MPGLSSLTWLKDNSPEPFGDANYYYHLDTRIDYRGYSSLKAKYPNATGEPKYYEQLPESYKYPRLYTAFFPGGTMDTGSSG